MLRGLKLAPFYTVPGHLARVAVFVDAMLVVVQLEIEIMIVEQLP
jgi:hypothetical protein